MEDPDWSDPNRSKLRFQLALQAARNAELSSSVIQSTVVLQPKSVSFVRSAQSHAGAENAKISQTSTAVQPAPGASTGVSSQAADAPKRNPSSSPSNSAPTTRKNSADSQSRSAPALQCQTEPVDIAKLFTPANLTVFNIIEDDQLLSVSPTGSIQEENALWIPSVSSPSHSSSSSASSSSTVVAASAVPVAADAPSTVISPEIMQVMALAEQQHTMDTHVAAPRHTVAQMRALFSEKDSSASSTSRPPVVQRTISGNRDSVGVHGGQQGPLSRNRAQTSLPTVGSNALVNLNSAGSVLPSSPRDAEPKRAPSDRPMLVREDSAIESMNAASSNAAVENVRGPLRNRLLRCFEYANLHRLMMLDGDVCKEPVDAIIVPNIPSLACTFEPSRKFADRFPFVKDLCHSYVVQNGPAAVGGCVTIRMAAGLDIPFRSVLFAIGPPSWTGDASCKISVKCAVKACLEECARLEFERVCLTPLTGGCFGAPEMNWLAPAQPVLEAIVEFSKVSKSYLATASREISSPVYLDMLFCEKVGIAREIFEALLQKSCVKELDLDAVVFAPSASAAEEVEEDYGKYYDPEWSPFAALPLEDRSNPDVDVAFDVKTNRHLIKAGTVEGILRRLTAHMDFDSDSLFAFLLTYRSFMSPKQLFELLVRRFQSIPRAGLGSRAVSNDRILFGRFRKHRLLPIRLRVCQVLKTWVEDYIFDFVDNAQLLPSIWSFSNMVIGVDMKAAGESLRRSVEKAMEDVKERKFLAEHGHLSVFKDHQVVRSSVDGNAQAEAIAVADATISAIDELTTNMGSSLLADGFPPLPARTMDIMDWPASDIAKQLTLLDFAAFCSIPPKEFLGQAWMKSNRDEIAPCILRVTDRFNRTCRWIAFSILRHEDIRDRRTAYSKVLSVAEECRKLNNFNAVLVVVAALNNAAVHRLKRTREELPSKSSSLFMKLEQLVSRESSYKSLRDALHNANPPCVPYLGMYLTDLTFIDEGNKNMVRENMVNFSKCRLIAQVIREIQTYQQTPYKCIMMNDLSALLADADGPTDNALYELSLAREPREPKPAS
eukprot:ANDGO_01991.mRNA.1 Ras guanine nucleotide exchange factor J